MITRQLDDDKVCQAKYGELWDAVHRESQVEDRAAGVLTAGATGTPQGAMSSAHAELGAEAG